MSIISQIKKDNLGYRKSKDIVKSNLTTTLLGEIQTEVKNNPNEKEDKLVEEILKKFKKNLERTPSDTQQEELQIIEGYLPKQMTEQEVEEYIKSNFDLNDYPVKARLIGTVLKEIGGKTDGKVVSKVLKSL